MKKSFAALVSTALGLGSLAVASPSNAIAPPYLPACATATSVDCIAAFALNGSAQSLPVITSADSNNGTSFDATGLSGFTAGSDNSNTFNVKVNLIPAMYGDAAGGLAQLEVFNQPELIFPSGRTTKSQVTPGTRIKLTLNLSKAPGGAIARATEGTYELSESNGVYTLVIDAKPLAEFNAGWVGNEVAQVADPSKKELSIFKLDFNGASALLNPVLAFMPINPMYVLESNAQTYEPPSIFGGDTFTAKVNSPHFLSDGVTLNSGIYRLVANSAFLETLGLSRDLALNSGITATTVETGVGATTVAETSIEAVGTDWVSVTLKNFHYSEQTVAIKGKSTLKTSKTSWSGKKSSIKKGAALKVKTATTSNKKKAAAGSVKVELVTAAGKVALVKTANVKKGSGTVSFAKSETATLTVGTYKVRITYRGAGTAKSTSKSYNLKVK